MDIVVPVLIAAIVLSVAGLVDRVALGAQPRDGGGAISTADDGRLFAPFEAWVDGHEVGYFDLGANTPLDGDEVSTAPIWVFIHGFDESGQPRFFDGQASVVDTVPGVQGYSDLWDVHFVITPEGYDLSAMRSRVDVEASGLEIMRPGMLVNCPIVPADSVITTELPLRPTWFEGEQYVYFHLGSAPQQPNEAWVFVTGFDEAGRPVVVPDQYPVVSAGLDDENASAFHRLSYVTVPASYEANTIRSAADLAASGFRVTETDILLNWPLTEHEERDEPAAPAPGVGY